jgi:hypothetical protein
MNPERNHQWFRLATVIVCSVALVPGDTLAYGFPQSSQATTSTTEAT